MNDNIRSMIDSNQYAEYMATVNDRLKAHERGYKKGYERGMSIGIICCIALFMLINLIERVL